MKKMRNFFSFFLRETSFPETARRRRGSGRLDEPERVHGDGPFVKHKNYFMKLWKILLEGGGI